MDNLFNFIKKMDEEIGILVYSVIFYSIICIANYKLVEPPKDQTEKVQKHYIG